MKKFRIVLCCLVGIIGMVICILDSIVKEEEYVYYEWQPAQDQMEAVEAELVKLNIDFSEDFVIDKMITHRTFVPDMEQKVEIYYYSGEGKTVAEKESISYAGNSSCGLHTLVLTEGTEHREKLIAVTLGKMGIVIVLMGLCVLPYQKIYKKLGGL